MSPHANKNPEKKNQVASESQSQSKADRKSSSHFVDNQHQSVTQKKVQEMADNSPQAAQLKSVQEIADNSTQTAPVQKKENNTGLPDNLKGGIENLSGISLDDVKVHRNSDKPSQLQAHAYAQGTDIHLGPGQEKHLPHEAWHVVQQKQGRVQPTKQLKGATNINDDSGLEKEADVMGARANTHLPKQFGDDPETKESNLIGSEAPVQAMMSVEAFQALTTLGESRKSIAVIDDAIREYHQFLLLPVDIDNQVANRQEKLRLINVIRQVTTAYINEKVRTDPTNPRIAPVRDFREDVLLEINQINGVVVSDFLINESIDDRPDDNATRLLILSIAKAPKSKNWVQHYLETTSDPQKIATMDGLYAQGDLVKILDQAFINGAGTDAILAFPKGNGLSANQRGIIKLFVDRVTDLGTLKKLSSQRFDIDVANIKGLEAGQPDADGTPIQAEVDWTLAGLKRAHGVMNLLPDGHAASNTRFASLKRYQDTSGWYNRGTSTVAIGYNDLNFEKPGRRTLSDKWNKKGQDVFEGKNYFDATVRHEVGHAVDHRHGFSDVYCLTGNGGGWLMYNGDGRGVVQEYLDLNNSALSNHPACLGMVKLEIAKLITATADMDAVKTEVIRMMNITSNAAGIPFNRTIVDNDPIFEDMQKANLQTPWKTSGGKVVGGRTFVYSNDNSVASYDSGARARQVSNYQFRASGEWFAEAYAAYYDPDQSPLGHGAALNSRDANTFTYIQTNVDVPL
jgi:hypothetical protein